MGPHAPRNVTTVAPFPPSLGAPERISATPRWPRRCSRTACAELAGAVAVDHPHLLAGGEQRLVEIGVELLQRRLHPHADQVDLRRTPTPRCPPRRPRSTSGRQERAPRARAPAGRRAGGPAGPSSSGRARTRLPRTSTSARPSSSFSSTPCQPSPRWRTGWPTTSGPSGAGSGCAEGGRRGEQVCHRLRRQPLAAGPPRSARAGGPPPCAGARWSRGGTAPARAFILPGDVPALLRQRRLLLGQPAAELLGVGALDLQAVAGLGQLLAHPLHLGDQPPQVAVLGAQPRLGAVAATRRAARAGGRAPAPRCRPGGPGTSRKVGRPVAGSNSIAAQEAPASSSAAAASCARWVVITPRLPFSSSPSSSASASAAPSSGSVPEPSSSSRIEAVRPRVPPTPP